MQAYKPWNAVIPGSEAVGCVMDGTPGVGTTGFWEGRETGLGGDRGKHTKQLEEQPLERVCRGRAGWSGEHELLATHFVCSG